MEDCSHATTFCDHAGKLFFDVTVLVGVHRHLLDELALISKCRLVRDGVIESSDDCDILGRQEDGGGKSIERLRNFCFLHGPEVVADVVLGYFARKPPRNFYFAPNRRFNV